MAIIELDALTKVFPGAGSSAVTAVDHVTLTVASGELFFLLGPSGCGKTTLLRMIAGLTEPTAGRIRFGGRDVTELSVERRDTAMVFQSYALWPHMTVGQNVQFGPRMRGKSRREAAAIAAAQLERVQMGGYERRKPNQLSGGQQQRVAVARALAAGSGVLLLDEPLSNLDAQLRLHMRSELRRLVKDTGVTAIYVTHDQKEALSMADRIAVFRDGRVVQVGPPEELYNAPASRFVADFLGEADFIEGKVSAAGQIETPAGVLRADTGSLPAGAAVTACLRPERIGLNRPAGENPWPATVLASTYLGEVRQYLCRLSDGREWKVFVLGASAAPLADGQAVTLSFAATDVAVLEA
jgi:iron(III) transport system ATP-binding protein